MTGRRRLLLILLFLFPSSTHGQGVLQRSRSGPPPQPAKPTPLPFPTSRLDKNSSANGASGLAGEGMGALVAGGLATVTSPFWAPPLLLGDDYVAPAYFTPYPYSGMFPGFLSVNEVGD